MRRRTQFSLPNGYAVIAIPEDGLFSRNGVIITADGTPVDFDELILFSRQADAQRHAGSVAQRWENGDANGRKWEFLAIGVLVRERV